MKPWTGRRNVIGRCLTLAFQQNRHFQKIAAVPDRPWLQALKPFAIGVDLQLNVFAAFTRSGIGGLAGREVFRWHLGCGLRSIERERFTVATGQSVLQRIERQTSRQRECSDQFGAGDEVHRGRLAVISAWKVAVIRRNNCIGCAGCFARPAPLSNAGAAGIRQHGCVDVLERLHLSVALDRGAHLLRTWRDQQWHGCLDAVRGRLRSNVGGAAHVFVRRVGAASDQSRGDFIDKAVAAVRDLGGKF